jgi:hypothetical protein
MRRMQMLAVTLGAVVTAAAGSWLTAGLAAVIAIVGFIAFRRLRGTTLAAPAVWTVIAAISLAVVEVALVSQRDDGEQFTASLWRYAAAVGTICPLMAVLGAKRPQDRGWQWIVLALWVVLLVPAAQAVAGRSAQQLELFTAWRLLLGALIAMSVLNYLPTRHAASALLFATGQSLILWPYLSGRDGGPTLRLIGLGGIAAAALWALCTASRCAHNAEPPSSLLALQNRRWRAFRDGWGAFWGLRVLQRVNQTAELSRWPVRLEWWTGLVVSDGDQVEGVIAVDKQTVEQIEQAFDSLLRRFERVEVRG